MRYLDIDAQLKKKKQKTICYVCCRIKALNFTIKNEAQCKWLRQMKCYLKYIPSGKGLILNIILGGSLDGELKAKNWSTLKEEVYY